MHRQMKSRIRRGIAGIGLLACGLGTALVGGAAPSTAVLTANVAAAQTQAAASPLKGLAFELITKGLAGPIDVTVPADDGLIYVVERTGTIRIIEGGRILKDPFANLKGVVKSNSIEQGLLGIAFHPKYPEDRRVFLFHSIRGNDNVLVSYEVSSDGKRADLRTRNVLLTVDKEPDAVRHNAGALRFGPDGKLYVSVGDAARASVNGQNPKTLPGTILRLDVDAQRSYAIPPDNPFADGKAGAPEVWWYGLRNPWRFSIDAKTGLAYIGDVGQESIEEIDVAPIATPGLNFGWPLFEGNKRFYSGEPKTPVVPPVVEHKHADGACSITGGEVYRGSAIPELDGHYFYADWCLGWIRSFRYDGSAAVDRKDWSSRLKAKMVSAFGHDSNGELLVVDYQSGTLSRVVPVR